jgi:RNase P subunit RPR2
MARAEQKTKIGEIRNQSDWSSALVRSTCLRCGGLMVKEFSLDLTNSSSEVECATRRCLQCGDILDPVILRNRHFRQESTTVQHADNHYGAIGLN